MDIPNFRQLQLDQYQHEQTYKVISGGEKRADRMQYFTMQLCKLGLRLEEQAIDEDMIDSGYSLALRPMSRILARNGLNWLLRGANELNINLATYIAAPVTAMPRETLQKAVLIGVGKMSKACEALDHLEKYPSREVLEENIIAVTQVVVDYSLTAGIDLTDAMRKHWMQEARFFPKRPAPKPFFIPMPANET